MEIASRIATDCNQLPRLRDALSRVHASSPTVAGTSKQRNSPALAVPCQGRGEPAHTSHEYLVQTRAPTIRSPMHATVYRVAEKKISSE